MVRREVVSRGIEGVKPTRAVGCGSEREALEAAKALIDDAKARGLELSLVVSSIPDIKYRSTVPGTWVVEWVVAPVAVLMEEGQPRVKYSAEEWNEFVKTVP